MSIIDKAKADGAKLFLKPAGVSITTVERDVEAAKDAINDDEKILLIVACRMRKMIDKRTHDYLTESNVGALIFTDRKILFVDKGLIGESSFIINPQTIRQVEVKKKNIGLSGEIIMLVDQGEVLRISDYIDYRHNRTSYKNPTFNAIDKGFDIANSTLGIVSSILGVSSHKRPSTEIANVLTRYEFFEIKKEHIGEIQSLLNFDQ